MKKYNGLFLDFSSGGHHAEDEKHQPEEHSQQVFRLRKIPDKKVAVVGGKRFSGKAQSEVGKHENQGQHQHRDQAFFSEAIFPEQNRRCQRNTKRRRFAVEGGQYHDAPQCDEVCRFSAFPIFQEKPQKKHDEKITADIVWDHYKLRNCYGKHRYSNQQNFFGIRCQK